MTRVSETTFSHINRALHWLEQIIPDSVGPGIEGKIVPDSGPDVEKEPIVRDICFRIHESVCTNFDESGKF